MFEKTVNARAGTGIYARGRGNARGGDDSPLIRVRYEQSLAGSAREIHARRFRVYPLKLVRTVRADMRLGVRGIWYHIDTRHN